MTKETITRRAADNEYLHKDFHGALSVGLEYLEKNYGERAVREFLHRFATTFHAPLTEAVNRRGLVALKEYFAKLYDVEGGDVRITLSEDELSIEVAACPAVTHMREQGYTVARLFSETTRTVNEAICESTPFMAELVEYDEQTGRSIQRFYRRRG
jgi:hypothetical protein